MTSEPPVVEDALVVCKECGMPVKVRFSGGEIVAVFAVCGHVKMPAEETPRDESSDPA